MIKSTGFPPSLTNKTPGFKAVGQEDLKTLYKGSRIIQHDNGPHKHRGQKGTILQITEPPRQQADNPYKYNFEAVPEGKAGKNQSSKTYSIYLPPQQDPKFTRIDQ